MSLAPRRVINHFRTPRGNPSSSSFSSLFPFFFLLFPFSLFHSFLSFSLFLFLRWGGILECNRDHDLGMINQMIWSGAEVMVFIEYGDWWGRVIGGGARIREICECWRGRGIKVRRAKSIGKCR